jgi:hypothetical protein
MNEAHLKYLASAPRHDCAMVASTPRTKVLANGCGFGSARAYETGFVLTFQFPAGKRLVANDRTAKNAMSVHRRASEIAARFEGSIQQGVRSAVAKGRQRLRNKAQI